MKLLVTGGCGFIGGHFIDYILKKYPNYYITNLDNLSYAANKDNININSSNYEFVKGDICNFELVNKITNDVDCIINFAAQSHVDRSFLDENIFFKTNTQGVVNLLNCSKNKNIKKFLQISTDEVYGQNLSNIPNSEISLLNPSNPYSASKAAADLFCLSYYKSYKVPVVISRSSNNYGTGQHTEKFIPHSISCLLKGKKIQLYSDGSQVRDWLNVKDNVRALDILLHQGHAGEIYNISGKNLLKNIDVAHLLLDKFALNHENIEFVQDRPSHDQRYYIDSSKIECEFNFTPKADFESSLDELISWYKIRT